MKSGSKKIDLDSIVTTSRIKRLKKCVETIGYYGHFSEGQDGFQALLELKQFVDELEGDVSPYGYCPHCGERSVSRERRVNGNDTCEKGHVYPSRASRCQPSKSRASAAPTAASETSE